MTPPQAPVEPGSTPTAQTLALMADALAWPLLLLRRDGTLLHGNAAARRLLQRRRPLALSARGVVAPTESARRVEFEAAVAAVASGGPPQWLPWTDRNQRMSVCISALVEPGRANAVVLLALSPVDSDTADLRAYAALHGLSEAETRVLLRLACGESSVQAARELGVSAATVRTQTANLRHKTGHTSVAALLRTLASLPPLALPYDDPEGPR